MVKQEELKNLETEVAEEQKKKSFLLSKLQSLQKLFNTKKKEEDNERIEEIRKQIQQQ